MADSPKTKKTELPQRRWVRKDRGDRRNERRRQSYSTGSVFRSEKQSKVQSSTAAASNEVLIGDWIKNNEHPTAILQVLQSKGIHKISDFGKPSFDEMEEIFNLLGKITDERQNVRLQNDIVNYRLIFKYDDPAIMTTSEQKYNKMKVAEAEQKAEPSEAKLQASEAKAEPNDADTKVESLPKAKSVPPKVGSEHDESEVKLEYEALVALKAQLDATKGDTYASKVGGKAEEKSETSEVKMGRSKASSEISVSTSEIKLQSTEAKYESKETSEIKLDSSEYSLEEKQERSEEKLEEKLEYGQLASTEEKYPSKEEKYESELKMETEPRVKTQRRVKTEPSKAEIALRYLGFYKVVILDYLHHKRIDQEPIIETAEIEKNKSYSCQITIYIPIQMDYVPIHGFSCGANDVWAEFYAFKNLFDQLVVNGDWIDRKTLNGLIRKYKTFNLNPLRNREVLWWYFYNFKQFRDSGEYKKAEYFYNRNISDALGGPMTWVKVRISKQCVWVDGFHYLFSDETEASKKIEKIITEESRDLVFVWMKSYNSRKEFFSIIMKHGLLNGLDYLRRN